jgi:hypothetical protein
MMIGHNVVVRDSIHSKVGIQRTAKVVLLCILHKPCAEIGFIIASSPAGTHAVDTMIPLSLTETLT